MLEGLSGVRFVVDLFHPGGRYVGVYLCRRKRLMAEQFLNASEVGAVVEHVGGEAVSQGMRADRGVEARGAEVLVHLSPDAAGAESLAVLVGKEDFGVEGAVVGHPSVSEFDVVLYRLEGAGADGRDSFLLAFAADVNYLAEEIDVIHVEGYELADSHAGAVEDLEYGAVSCSQPRVGRRGVEELLDLFVFEKLGELLVLLGGLDADDRVRCDIVSLYEELVEASERGELSCAG